MREQCWNIGSWRMDGVEIIMKYYKDAQNKVYAFESDGSQDAFISPSLASITAEQADALRATLPSVPTAITMRQARLALLQNGHLAAVTALIESMPGAEGAASRIEWEFASDVLRDHPLVAAMAQAIPLTTQQIADLFELGATL